MVVTKYDMVVVNVIIVVAELEMVGTACHPAEEPVLRVQHSCLHVKVERFLYLHSLHT
jgi:hypothetical protein